MQKFPSKGPDKLDCVPYRLSTSSPSPLRIPDVCSHMTTNTIAVTSAIIPSQKIQQRHDCREPFFSWRRSHESLTWDGSYQLNVHRKPQTFNGIFRRHSRVFQVLFGFASFFIEVYGDRKAFPECWIAHGGHDVVKMSAKISEGKCWWVR